MDLGAIDLAIEDGSFALNDEVLGFAAKVKASGGVASSRNAPRARPFISRRYMGALRG
jgi:hypothetical protein